ncbi:thiamine pyrophosphate-dependent enzyme [Myxococcota bacterium]|nr:thiamine pyrophosphate-dependent enzyme [Myxococcota bacterium]
MTRAAPSPAGIPEPTDDELRLAYRVAVRSRSTEEHIVRLVSRGEVKFAIWGPGEEVHGTATALALSRLTDPARFGVVPHYRSGSLCAMWCELNGREGFTLDVLRQQFSKSTDAMSGGRQMVYHLDIREVGILPVQSPVGMQLGKAAGYAMGFKVKGVTDALTLGIVGDGTTAEGDLHDAMNAISVWSLPTIVMVTDNGVAISTRPDEGRGIKDFAAYAASFGVRFFSCDGRDFWQVHATSYECARYVRDEQKPAFLYVHSLPRFNGHSSAADVTFDLGQQDPLVAFGQALVRRGVLQAEDVLKRVPGEGRDFFAHHALGAVMQAEDEVVSALIEKVRFEPDPLPDRLFDHVYPAFPSVQETPGQGQTHVTYGGAIRAAIDHIIQRHNGVLWGQDVGRLGGVMQATAGLKARHPDKIIDAPLNEPLILGTACGAGLHPDLVVMPEIQFGDYTLNAFHWLVHMGNLYWTTAGNSRFATILRTPTDPFGGGAVYHSMSIDGYFTPIPGLVVIMPSTSWDVYGLLMTAAEYKGPVVCLEPKWMYRQTLGPAFPGEPTDSQEIAALKKSIMRGEIPHIDPELRVPFGKAATRRTGSDVTVVAWGRAVWTAMHAAQELAREGVQAEVIDLRTLVPPDLETVAASVARTGRLVVAAEDRSFAGFVRSIQGAMVERFPGLPTRALGQKNVPGIAQSLVLEDATVLTWQDVVDGVRAVMETRIAASAAAGWSWIPPRYFLG